MKTTEVTVNIPVVLKEGLELMCDSLNQSFDELVTISAYKMFKSYIDYLNAKIEIKNKILEKEKQI